MKKSESIKNIAKALVSFQAAMAPISKDHDNPFFKSRYVTLDAVIEATRDPLSLNGLAVIQAPDGKKLVTVLLHDSGEFFQFEDEIIHSKANDPQSYGAGITYLKRFALKAVLKLSDDDDDGETASGRGNFTQQPKGFVNETTDARFNNNPIVRPTQLTPRPKSPIGPRPVTRAPVEPDYPALVVDESEMRDNGNFESFLSSGVGIQPGRPNQVTPHKGDAKLPGTKVDPGGATPGPGHGTDSNRIKITTKKGTLYDVNTDNFLLTEGKLIGKALGKLDDKQLRDMIKGMETVEHQSHDDPFEVQLKAARHNLARRERANAFMANLHSETDAPM